MKNPWMSLWLSAANQAAGTTRAFWSAETARQQKAFAKAMTDSIFPKFGAPKSKSKSAKGK